MASQLELCPRCNKAGATSGTKFRRFYGWFRFLICNHCDKSWKQTMVLGDFEKG